MATYDSLCYLRDAHPDCEFVFVIGSDWLQPGTDIREWHSKEGRTGEQLLNEFDFLVLPRPGYDVDDIKAFGPRMYWLTLPENFQMVESNASSSEVRKRAKTQWLADPKHGQNLQALNGLVPPGVHAFCLRNRLYEYLARPEARRYSFDAGTRPLATLTRSPKGPKRRIGILGGAFSPITNMHVQMATEIVISGHVDEVWLVPSGPRPDKPNMRVSPRQRYIMCEIAVNTGLSSSFPVRVSDHEVKHNEPLATYDSLSYLREHHDGCQFVFILGSDWLQPGTSMREWSSKEGRTGEQLLDEFDFLVLPRPGHEQCDLTTFGPRIQWLTLPDGFKCVESNASSTELKKRAKFSSLHGMNTAADGEYDLRAMDGLLPPAVLSYIRRHKLHEDLAHDFDLLGAKAATGKGGGRRASVGGAGAHPALREGI